MKPWLHFNFSVRNCKSTHACISKELNCGLIGLKGSTGRMPEYNTILKRCVILGGGGRGMEERGGGSYIVVNYWLFIFSWITQNTFNIIKYILCWSVVCIKKILKRLNPNFVYDLTWPKERFMNAQNYLNIFSEINWFSLNFDISQTKL